MITPCKKGLISLAFIGALLVPAFPASAQTYQTYGMNCVQLNYNLSYGIRGSDVTALQAFLATQGYFPYSPIGVFGPMTFRAVQNFQAAHAISPTGYVGPLTRAIINALQNCNNPVPPIPPIQTPYIQSLYPSSGPVGTTVTIYGSGLFGTNTIYFGGSSREVYSSNGTSVSFTIPDYFSPCPPGAYCIMMARQVTPSIYPIYIQNSGGTSNTINFTVTGSTNTQPVSITGIDAPAALRVGQTGTWTVRTNLENYTYGSNIRYSVTWGDEATYPYAMSSYATPVQTSASLSHTYYTPGTYRPTFTVTNEAGQSTSASATVIVSY